MGGRMKRERTRKKSFVWFLDFVSLTQDGLIEVDENGTLDLSMKKNRDSAKAPPPAPPGESLPTPASSPTKSASVRGTPAFFQALCEQDTWDTPLNYSKVHAAPDREVKRGRRRESPPPLAFPHTHNLSREAAV